MTHELARFKALQYNTIRQVIPPFEWLSEIILTG